MDGGGGSRGSEQEDYQEQENMAHLMMMLIGKGRQASGGRIEEWGRR